MPWPLSVHLPQPEVCSCQRPPGWLSQERKAGTCHSQIDNNDLMG